MDIIQELNEFFQCEINSVEQLEEMLIFNYTPTDRSKLLIQLLYHMESKQNQVIDEPEMAN